MGVPDLRLGLGQNACDDRSQGVADRLIPRRKTSMVAVDVVGHWVSLRPWGWSDKSLIRLRLKRRDAGQTVAQKRDQLWLAEAVVVGNIQADQPFALGS